MLNQADRRSFSFMGGLTRLLGASAFNLTLQIANQKPSRHRSQIIITLWSMLVDILNMHYFYLGFAMFIHTLLAQELNYQEKIKTSSTIFWGAEVNLSLLFAILSNTRLRNKIRHTIFGEAICARDSSKIY